jgi:parallel beta-helix repeat protein
MPRTVLPHALRRGTILLAALILLPSASAAQAPCGVVVDNTTLRSDCEGPLIVANSNIEVNLAHHVITCHGDPSRDGIEIVNQTNVRITNGVVLECGTGIDVQGGGGHRITGLTIVFGTAAGPPLDFATSQIGDGIRLADSHGNRLRAINSQLNDGAGIRLVRSTGNELREVNTLNQTTGVDLMLQSDNNVVRSSFAFDHNGPGFSVSMSTGNTFEANEGDMNGGGLALLAGAAFTVIRANRFERNDILGGIRVSAGATNNLLQANNAVGNTPLDLVDDNPNCDANVWKANRFITTNQPQCVR